ncbi:acrosomal protein KIAA1210-like [Tachyglossus aculeatus]|uniref:acrosomal protein KIAA1210-like n=1 Tax=Tachyglossus aculeatus TaxID=9261 RepID=UPI0018F49250|nr:acrosomal protein KIAA1210-like [Tachyglossus aculeatus]
MPPPTLLLDRLPPAATERAGGCGRGAAGRGQGLPAIAPPAPPGGSGAGTGSAAPAGGPEGGGGGGLGRVGKGAKGGSSPRRPPNAARRQLPALPPILPAPAPAHRLPEAPSPGLPLDRASPLTRPRPQNALLLLASDYIMATGPADVTRGSGAEETSEEGSGKKKSRFQTFKNFFAKKKRKEPLVPHGESNLKPSQSSSDVNNPPLNTIAFHSPAEPGSKAIMGNKALSHDSVFILESGSENLAGDQTSQENLSGKVKALQLQLQQNIRLGSPPLVITGRRSEDTGAVSEDDGLPRSPPEISTLHEVLTCSSSKSSNPVQRHSSLSLGGTDSEDEQISSDTSSRPISPLSAPGMPASPASLLAVDFNTPASPFACLDTSAARHKIALNPRKQRSLASRSQQMSVDPQEKEPSLPVIAEGENITTKLLGSDQSIQDLEGSSVQEHSSVTEIRAEKTSGPDNNMDATASQGNQASATWEADCVLGEANVSRTDDADSETAPCPKRQRDQAACSPSEMARECKLQPPSPTQKDVELLMSPQMEIDGSGETSSHWLSVEKGDADSSLEAGWVLLSKPRAGALKEPIGSTRVPLKVGLSLGHKNSCNPALPGISQVVLPHSEIAPRAEKPAAECAAWRQPGNPRVTREDAEVSAVLEAQVMGSTSTQQKGPTPPPPGVSGRLPSRRLSEELRHKRELPRLFPKPGREDLPLASTPESSDKPVMRCQISSRSADAASEQLVGAGDEGPSPSDCLVSQVQARKLDQGPEDPTKSPLPSATKPVRFTIAPAWQRTISGGTASKEESCIGNCPSPIKPESFEGTARENAPLDSSTSEPAKTNPEGSGGGERNNGSCPSSPTEWADFENPFGVKLRRTSSSRTYGGEKHRDSPKLVSFPISPASSASVREDPNPSGTGRTPQRLPASTKCLSKKSDSEEETNSTTKAGDMTKKQDISKPSEKVPNPPWEMASSEPAWITVAKLKQKGFQGRPLAKGHHPEDRAVPDTENEETVNYASENQSRKNSVSSLCKEDKTAHMKIAISSITVIPVEPGVQEISSQASAIEKEMRQSSALPVLPRGPMEPPWLSLAKKKAKAWSEMPQIVQ